MTFYCNTVLFLISLDICTAIWVLHNYVQYVRVVIALANFIFKFKCLLDIFTYEFWTKYRFVCVQTIDLVSVFVLCTHSICT